MLKFSKSFASLAFAVLLMADASPAQQKAVKSPAWYAPFAADMNRYERGDVSELKDKRRVFVSVWAFSDLNSNVETAQLKQQVLHDFKKYDGLEVVSTPEEADFAVHFEADTSQYGAGCKYYVATRGAESINGAPAPRVLQRSSTLGNECTAWASRRVGNLVETLKRLRGEK